MWYSTGTPAWWDLTEIRTWPGQILVLSDPPEPSLGRLVRNRMLPNDLQVYLGLSGRSACLIATVFAEVRNRGAPGPQLTAKPPPKRALRVPHSNGHIRVQRFWRPSPGLNMWSVHSILLFSLMLFSDSFEEDLLVSAFHRADWLSLAQSIVTLVAVAGAVAVARYTRHLDSEVVKESNRKRRRKALALASVAIGRAIETAGELNAAVSKGVIPADRLNNAVEVIEDCRDRFGVLPYAEFLTGEVTAIERARGSLTKLISISRKWREELVDEDGNYLILSEIGHVVNELRASLSIVQQGR